MGRPIYFEPGLGEGFGANGGDDYTFEIVPARNAARLAQIYPTRLQALEAHLHTLEVELRNISAAIARAKRLRRTWKQQSPNLPGVHDPMNER